MANSQLINEAQDWQNLESDRRDRVVASNQSPADSEGRQQYPN